MLAKGRELTEKQLFESAESKEEFKKQFSGIFGGPSKIHPTEKKLGVFTGCPTITDIRRTKEFEEAAEDVEIAKNFNKAIRELTEVPPNQRAIFLAAMKGGAHIEYVDLSSFSGKGNLIFNARGTGGNQSKNNTRREKNNENK
jgi:truncated hemoglobin YjbI